MAQKLGADELGMKSHVIAFLRAGPVKLTDSLERMALQKAHLKNILRLQFVHLLISNPCLHLPKKRILPVSKLYNSYHLSFLL